MTLARSDSNAIQVVRTNCSLCSLNEIVCPNKWHLIGSPVCATQCWVLPACGGRKLPKAILAQHVPNIETEGQGSRPVVSCGMARQHWCVEGLSGMAWATIATTRGTGANRRGYCPPRGQRRSRSYHDKINFFFFFQWMNTRHENCKEEEMWRCRHTISS